MNSLPRRIMLKIGSFSAACLGLSRHLGGQNKLRDRTGALTTTGHDEPTHISWEKCHDRVWLHPRIWANPMEDWAVRGGWAECLTLGGNRNLHLITHQWAHLQGNADISVKLQAVEEPGERASAGFRIGIQSELNEFRSNCFANSGINIGIAGNRLIVGRIKGSKPVSLREEIKLTLSAKCDGKRAELSLKATAADGSLIDTVSHVFNADELLGNLALVNNFEAKLNSKQGGRFRFNDWSISGSVFEQSDSRKFGPILWSMYSLSDSRSVEGFVLKISALTGPLGEKDNKKIELQTQVDGVWKSHGETSLDTDAWTATFRIPQWDEKKATPYRLIYREQNVEGEETLSSWGGMIKANPIGRPLRVGALTCQNHYGFPYEPVAENLIKLDPDLLYFSGDQLYESHGGYGVIREPADLAILNYLRKYYMFGWAFRDAMRDRPTLCIADDHDVFQGNIWGQGGIPMDTAAGGTSSNGGYRQPARMVNAVHRTNTSHHPDCHDAKPAEQGISIYFGEMIYGNVGFAILGDRQFKSGPQLVDTGSGRADHVKDPEFDTTQLDQEGLELLGVRQEEFLKKWSQDWRGHDMKILLSQTVFAGVATHHGNYDGYLKADLDSGGWPQTARDRALEILSDSQALHINGDQHLTSLAQYGVQKQRDSLWSFCTPAIAAGYPRWWRPDEVNMPHRNRPKHGLSNTGEYLDGFGNKIYVYAVGNPKVGTKKNRYEKAHQKGSGFGLVTVDTDAKTYLIDSYRFLIDATDENPANQFPGWPVLIHQAENAGDNQLS